LMAARKVPVGANSITTGLDMRFIFNNKVLDADCRRLPTTRLPLG
jgi:hypothetical protein